MPDHSTLGPDRSYQLALQWTIVYDEDDAPCAERSFQAAAGHPGKVAVMGLKSYAHYSQCLVDHIPVLVLHFRPSTGLGYVELSYDVSPQTLLATTHLLVLPASVMATYRRCYSCRGVKT